MKRSFAFPFAALLLTPLAGCAALQEFELKTGVTPAIAEADLAAFVDALPGICQKIAAGVAITDAELAVIQANTKLPARTVVNIANAGAQVQNVCAGSANAL
jgi:Zn-dependent protease